jgi:hypothetical protein
MNTRKRLANLRAVSVALLAAFIVAACGGSGSGSAPEPVAETADSGTVGLWFTDLPTDDFSSITLTVSEATLIAEDDSHHVLFTGERHIDLLDLTNYSEPVIFGEVPVGTYKKIRLMIERIELWPVCPPDTLDCDPKSMLVDKLPANGKVDLLQPDGFDVLPGREVAVEIDIDANKAIHIVGAGKSGKIKFRPVVKVNVYDRGMPHKLARLKGAVGGEPDGSNGSFVLCGIDAPDYCVDVATNTMTSFFDDVGLGTDFTGLSDGAMVVVIGEYSSDPILLNAIVVEIGGNEEQLTGEVVTEPANSQFLVLTIGGNDVTIELQPGTKYYDESGAIGADAIVLGSTVEVEGVMPEKADPEDPDIMRAALVFLEAPEDTLLSGTVTPTSQDADTMMFELVPDGDGATPVNVCVVEGASILLVNTTDMTVAPGVFADIVDDAIVDVFGTPPEAEGDCFGANEVIIDVTPAP